MCYVMGWRYHQLTRWQVPVIWYRHSISLPIRVITMPTYRYGRSTWIGRLLIAGHPLVRVTWVHPVRTIHLGETWQLPLQLKPLSQVRQWRGFNMARWLRSQGIRAEGKVITRAAYQPTLIKVTHQAGAVTLQRLRMQQLIRGLSIPLINKGILLALTTGSHALVPQSAWQIFQRTGTNHLIAIAGLHLGFVLTFTLFCSQWLWRCMPGLGLWWPRQSVCWWLSLLATWFYADMANFTLPTIRAVVMLSAMVLGQIIRIKLPWRARWLAAMLVVLTLNPLVVETASFWLSFISVLLIMYIFLGRLTHPPFWIQWCRIQGVLCVGLAPLTLYFFHQISFVGFVANAVAVPWVLFLILPICALAVVVVGIWPGVAGGGLQFASQLLTPLWQGLKILSHYHWSGLVVQSVPIWGMVVALVGVFCLCCPRGVPIRWLGIMCALSFVGFLISS